MIVEYVYSASCIFVHSVHVYSVNVSPKPPQALILTISYLYHVISRDIIVYMYILHIVYLGILYMHILYMFAWAP